MTKKYKRKDRRAEKNEQLLLKFLKQNDSKPVKNIPEKLV